MRARILCLAAATTLAAKAQTETSGGPPAYRVGQPGVSASRVISHIEPQYTDEARHAHAAGSTGVSLTVGPDGLPRDIRIKRAMGLGLDEKSLEAVNQWRFQPGTKDGRPVSIRATVEVHFRLIPPPGASPWMVNRVVFPAAEGVSRPILQKSDMP